MTTLQEFVQNLRHVLTLSDVIRAHVKLQKRGREYVGLCPFHSEKGPSFTVNDEKGFYHCFGCGAHGDLFEFVMQKLNLPFMGALDLLASQVGLQVPKFHANEDTGQSSLSLDHFYQVNELACAWFESQLRLAEAEHVARYLKQRRISKQTVIHFRLGYAPESGLKAFLLSKGFSEELLCHAGLLIQSENRQPYERFRKRLIFPIHDGKGKIVGFGGRIIDQGEPKYLNSPDTPLFHKGKMLYALHHALPNARQRQPFIVVEGYMDVISLHQGGISSAVAPLGTALTPEQIQLLWKAHPTPILFFDGDEAGKRAAERAALRCLEVIKPGCSLQFAFLPTGEDPDSLMRRQGQDVVREYLKKSLPLIEMLWRIFTHGRSWDTPEEKSKARQDLTDLTQTIRDPDTRLFYRKELNQRLQQHLMKAYTSSSTPLNMMHINPADRPILNSSQKTLQGQKILLATLINHPTLITEVAEHLMILEWASDALESLCCTLLALPMTIPDVSSEELIDKLKENGFSELIEELRQIQQLPQARFAKASAYEDILQGWHEIWQSVQEHKALQEETLETAAAMISSFDEGSWNRLKILKQSLMRSKN